MTLAWKKGAPRVVFITASVKRCQGQFLTAKIGVKGNFQDLSPRLLERLIVPDTILPGRPREEQATKLHLVPCLSGFTE